MPRSVAIVSLVSGLAVVAFGVALIAIGPPSDETSAAMPRATLAPRIDDDTDPPSTTRGIRGTVSDTDDDPVEGVDITLVPLFMEDGVDPMKTTTDDDGRFSFDVDVNPGSPWVAEATFDDARFPSDVLRAPRGKDDPVELVVARTTEEADDIEISAESLAVVGDKTGGQALHALTVVNSGERAYVGGLRLPLLKGATAIREGSGLDRRHLRLGSDEMTSVAPILPGRHDLTYTYIVQMARDGIAVTHRAHVDTARYELLVGEGLSLRADRSMRDDGEVTLGTRDAQRTYHRYVAQDLAAGDRLAARVTLATSPSAVRIAGFAIAGLVALLVIAAPLLRRRRTREPLDADDHPGELSIPGAAPPNASA